MPALSDIGLALNPSVEPSAYPGRVIDVDCLQVGSWMYELSPRQGERLDAARAKVDRGGPLAAQADDRTASLDELLTAAGAAPIGDRIPFVAIGSNGSPGQLIHKFAKLERAAVIPITIAVVSGIKAAYSAHVSKAGYIPYAPTVDSFRDNTRRLPVLWLDDPQLEHMHTTEPNYRALTIEQPAHPAVLVSSREPLASWSLYASKWGTLSFEPPTPVPAADQRSLYRALGNLPWFRDLVPAIIDGADAAIAALAADEDLRTRVRGMFLDRGHAQADGLPTTSSSPVTYNEGAGTKAWGVPGAAG